VRALALALVIATLTAGADARAEALDEDLGEDPLVLDPVTADNQTPRVVKVKVHVLATASGQVAATDERAAELVQGVATAFSNSGTPFVFELASIDQVIVEDGDFALAKDGRTEERLAGDREHAREPSVLHLYLVGRTCASKASGWAVLPGQGINAVFLRTESGVYTTEILVHEVGHWLGLLHVHERGCRNKDGVDDTPAQKEAPWTEVDRCAPDYVPPPPHDCSVPIDSCTEKDGTDSIDNYMSYWDECMTTFTPGQIDRMIRAWDRYRASDKGDGGDQAETPHQVPVFGCRVGTRANAPAGGALALLGLVALLRRRRR
jgi:MYXO-CTERM domain-containing protein